MVGFLLFPGFAVRLAFMVEVDQTLMLLLIAEEPIKLLNEQRLAAVGNIAVCSALMQRRFAWKMYFLDVLRVLSFLLRVVEVV